MTTKDEALKLALRSIRELVIDESDDAPALQGVRMRKLAAEKAIREALAEPNHEYERGFVDGMQKQMQPLYYVAHPDGSFTVADPQPVLQPAQQQEPVAWQILNGVCHAGIRSTEDLAKEAAAGMQKTHDLGGSLAAFHVRPLYTSPPTSKPWVGLTDDQIINVAKSIDIEFKDEGLAEQVDDILTFASAIETKLREKNA